MEKKLQALKATGIKVTGDQRKQVKRMSIFKHLGIKFTDGVRSVEECSLGLSLGILSLSIMETLERSHICSSQCAEGHAWLIRSRSS